MGDTKVKEIISLESPKDCLEAITTRVEAIALRLEAVAIGMEAIASKKYSSVFSCCMCFVLCFSEFLDSSHPNTI